MSEYKKQIWVNIKMSQCDMSPNHLSRILSQFAEWLDSPNGSIRRMARFAEQFTLALFAKFVHRQFWLTGQQLRMNRDFNLLAMYFLFSYYWQKLLLIFYLLYMSATLEILKLYKSVIKCHTAINTFQIRTLKISF